MADHQVEGKVGFVTSRIGPGRSIGEVMISVRGGSEAYYAFSLEGELLASGTQIVVIEYVPPRMVTVTPLHAQPQSSQSLTP